MRLRLLSSAVCVTLVIIVAACKDTPTAPETNLPRFRKVDGASGTDTIEARLAQALVVEVRDSLGTPRRGAVVRFEPRLIDQFLGRRSLYACKVNVKSCGPEANGAFSPVIIYDTTDAAGHARASIRLGSVPGNAILRISVDSMLVDSAVFTVTPGTPVAVRATAVDTIVNIGATAVLRSRVQDRYGNARTEVATQSAVSSTAFTFDAGTATVTGRDIGSGWVYTRFNSFVDSTYVAVTVPARFATHALSRSELHMINSDGSNAKVLTFVPKGPLGLPLGVFPRFDPTRQRVTYMQSSAAQIVSTTVIDTSTLTHRDIGPGTGFVTIMTVREMSNGDVMLVANRTGTPGFVVWRVAPDNTITFVAAPPGLQQIIGGADFSPDGTKLAYQAQTMLPSDLRIYDFATNTFRSFEVGATVPRWSPQSDKLAYINVSGKGITIANSDGSGRRVLGSAVFRPGLSWSPDGAHLVGLEAVGSSILTFYQRMVRVSDDAEVRFSFKNAAGVKVDYYEPDWR